MNTYLFTATQHNDRPRWRSGYFIGKWAGRYWVRISVPAPTQSIKQCLVLANVNKSKFVGSWAWRDQPIDQVGPFLTSRLHELRAAVVYCQWQCILLQTLTMTQPPGSHSPLHGLHLTANKVRHMRSCVDIGHSPRGSNTHRGTSF